MGLKRNIAHLLSYQLLTWVVTFAFLLYVPRQLGTDAVGAIGYAVAYVGFFALVAGLGTSTVLLRDIARDHSRLAPLVYNAIVLKVATGIVVPVVGVALAWAIGNRGDRMALIAIGFAGMVFTSFAEVAVGALNGLEIISKPALLTVIQTYIASGGSIIAVFLGYGVISLGFIGALGAFVPMLVALIMLRPHVHRRFHADRRIIRHLVRAGIPLMTLTVINVVYGTIDVPILGAIASDTEVGWYTVAYRWVGIPIFISTAVMTSYFPRFAAHGSPITPEFPRYVNQAIRIVMLGSVPCSIGLAMVADDLIRLIYQPDFYPSIPLIQILSIHIPLAALDTVLASALIAANQQRRYLYVALGAAVLNPLACVLLIHWAQGRYANAAIGAAIVTVATEAYILLGALRLKAPGVFDGAAILETIRIVAAGLAMIPVLLAARSTPLVVQVLLGAATYPVALLLFRAVRLDEIRRLIDSSPLGRRRHVPEPID